MRLTAIGLACIAIMARLSPCSSGSGNSPPQSSGKGCLQDKDCSSGSYCSGASTGSMTMYGTCVTPMDPFCMNGAPTCGNNEVFVASQTATGCIKTGDQTPPGAFTPPFDNPMGPCTGDIVVSCTNSPGCSFCINAAASIPPGCMPAK